MNPLLNRETIDIAEKLASRGVKRRSRRSHGRDGATMVFMAFLLPAILMVATYAINVVHMELVRTELQIGADVAARAAGRTLALTGDKQLAIEDAQRFASANTVCDTPLTLAQSDFLFGASVRLSDQRYTFRSSTNNIGNAVLVDAQSFARSNPNGLPLAFPSINPRVKFRPSKSAICTQVELDLAVVIDRSSSMAHAADKPSGSHWLEPAPANWTPGTQVPRDARWLDAVNMVQALLKIAEKSYQDERIALITFDRTPTVDVVLTANYSEIRDRMLSRSVTFSGGRSNLGGAIMVAAKQLGDKKHSRPWSSRVIVILSDGIANQGFDVTRAAKAAADQNITIYTVSLSDEANRDRMREIADLTSGDHFSGTTGNELTFAFREIASKLPTLISY